MPSLEEQTRREDSKRRSRRGTGERARRPDKQPERHQSVHLGHADRVFRSGEPGAAESHEGNVVIGEYGGHIAVRADRVTFDSATKEYVLEQLETMRPGTTEHARRVQLAQRLGHTLDASRRQSQRPQRRKTRPNPPLALSFNCRPWPTSPSPSRPRGLAEPVVRQTDLFADDPA